MRWVRRRFSRKIAFAFCGSVGAAFLLAYLVGQRRLDRALLEEQRQALVLQVRQCALLLSPDAFDHPERVQTLAEKILRVTGARLTLIRSDGKVVADGGVSREALGQVENHGSRVEVLAALRQGTGTDAHLSRTVGQRMLYAAAAFPQLDRAQGVLRLAVPLVDVEFKERLFARLLLSILGLAGLAGLGLAAWVAHWVGAPLEALTQATRRAVPGEAMPRVSVRSEDELGELAASFNRMGEELERAFRDLRSERDEMSSILSGMVEQVVAVDSQGRVLMINPAAERLFGVLRSQAQGKSFLEAIRQAPVQELLGDVLKERAPQRRTLRLFFPEERFFQAQALPMGGEALPPGALAVLHDITDLERVQQVRRDFVANVSHELRTPLTSIQGFAETLLSGALRDPKHNREFIQTIYDQADRLKRIVEDLLDLSAIESGKKIPAPSPFSLRNLMEELFGTLSPLAKKHGVDLRSEVPAEFPPLVADRDQMKQVFLNLLDNAIKFNHPGGWVRVQSEVAGSEMRITVQDSGIGIPQADLPRVFERFYRVDKGRSRQEGGTGLGLAIVKHIVESHRGRIGVESILGQGTTFRIHLSLS